MNKESIIQIIEEWFHKNYTAGNPRIAPHQHNGIDNLPVNSQDIIGGLVTQIVAGTNVTISPTTGIGVVTVNSSGGSGSPGGNNTDIQFNDSGSFGGQDSFTFNKSTNVVTLDDGSVSGFDGGQITGGTSGIVIRTNDTTAAGATNGFVQLFAGKSTGTGSNSGEVDISAGNAAVDGNPGSVDINAGNCGDISHSGGNDGGSVIIAAGSTGTANGGHVNIVSGSTTGAGTAGAITLNLGGVVGGTRKYVQISQFDSGGTIHPNVYIGSGTPSLGSGQGVIGIHNRSTAPSGTPSNGGILYVEAGALTYKGSSGTITTVAPA